MMLNGNGKCGYASLVIRPGFFPQKSVPFLRGGWGLERTILTVIFQLGKDLGNIEICCFFFLCR